MSRREPHSFEAPKDGAKVFWRSLADKENPEAAARAAEAELSDGVRASLDEARQNNLVTLRRRRGADDGIVDAPVGRRGFMFFAGAAAALFAEGCARRPVEKILPYSKAPEQILPGVPAHFATVRAQRGEALGLVVESHEGRPTKVEGNPDHPASLGSTDAVAQASIFDIYDPDRGTHPLRGTRGGAGYTHAEAEWADVDNMLADIGRLHLADGGARLRFLCEPSISPTFIRLRDAVRGRYPKAVFHTYTPVHDGNARAGAKLAFGQAVNVVCDYAQAKVILSLDADFLGQETGAVRATRGFATGRRPKSPADGMNRLYVVEPAFTVTGMNADHRLRLAAQDVGRYALALAKELSEKHGVELGAVAAAAKADVAGISDKWLAAVAKDLAAARGKSVIVAGSRQPAWVHALVHALNGALGNAGHAVQYFPAADPLEKDPVEDIKELVAAIDKGSVGTLVLFGGNPAYDAPADTLFTDKLRAVAQTVHLSFHVNETSHLCTWYVPRAHELETWGDLRALDGTVAIQQPLISPIFSGRSDLELLAKLAGETSSKGHDLVRGTLKGGGADVTALEAAWNGALKKGVLSGAAVPLGTLAARSTEVAEAIGKVAMPPPVGPQNLEITFEPCPKVFDGRHANNPWLLELPDPVTKITWDNVASVSPATAKALGLESGDLVRLTLGTGKSTEIAAWVMPGQAEGTIAVTLGWGRTKAGRYGDKHGFDVYPLRTTAAMGFGAGLKVEKLSTTEIAAVKEKFRRVGNAYSESAAPARIRPDDPFEVDTHRYKISQTQEHNRMEGRPVAIDATLAEYRAMDHFPQYPSRMADKPRKDVNKDGETIDVRGKGSPDPNVPPLWNTVDYSKGHKWGMAFDLSSCTGCNACVIACQSENNIPAVGKEQIWRGREMAWIRIDRYFVGLDENDPQISFQPVACVQCEEAPCENVCPVNATEHSPEGLNDMAYNRCIGTRYCANNCPYKVRRFNFLNYHTSGGSYDELSEIERMRYNPNVTVRMRGVMEKCNYCVQRIQEGKIASKRTGRPIRDGDITTACQQACPANAIVFGDLNDPESKVAKWHARDRAYRLLAELGTHPRTTYLGKIRNPNPEMS
jgi:Fe-S-cluster-containing dehydrogenase component